MGKKHTYEYVKDYFKARGCVLLETEYITSGTKLKYICECGNESTVTFDNFRRNRRCKSCGVIKYSNKQKLTQTEVDALYRSKNWINRSIYKNARQKLNVICNEGHVTTSTVSNFKNGFGCIHCQHINNSGENNKRWKQNRTHSIRSAYLSFDLKRICLLDDDPLYNLYLESQKKAKESTNGCGKTEYSVDHIHPRIAFIDNNLDEIYNKLIIKKICNLRENLRIISKEENGSKGGKYNQIEFMNWFNEKINLYNLKEI